MGYLALRSSRSSIPYRQVSQQLQLHAQIADGTCREALTYNAWNIFYDAYPDQIDRQQHFYVYEANEWSYEPRQLLSISNRLAKLETSLLTLLCVRDFSLTFDHLKALIKIPTLGALILEQARPSGISEITARQFTEFARAVREKEAFQKLKLLIMCDFGIGRKAVLDGAASWPALDLIGLQNSKATDTGDLFPATYDYWQRMDQNQCVLCPEATN
jgi:hypothetical protein